MQTTPDEDEIRRNVLSSLTRQLQKLSASRSARRRHLASSLLAALPRVEAESVAVPATHSLKRKRKEP